MKITKIHIYFEPTTEGENKAASELFRDENKMWSAKFGPNNEVRGLFPSEVKLAHMIQEDIVMKYNGGN